MSDTEHLVNRIIDLERENKALRDERDHWEHLFRYEANQRLQMLRWRQDFAGKGAAS